MAKFDKIPGVKESMPEIDDLKHGDLIDLVDNKLRHIVVDGRIIVQGSEGELLGYGAMYESIFVNNWISQFAIDEVNGKKYFNLNDWSAITNKLVEGVIIVEDNTNLPSFIIPSFIRPKLSQNAHDELNYYANKASNAINIVDKEQQTEFINSFARRMRTIMDKEPNDQYGLTNLIPQWVYDKYDVVPDAMKAMIYLRDFYNVELDDGEYQKVEGIFKRYYKGQSISDEEKKLILKLTNNQFNFETIEPTTSGDDKVKEKVKGETGFNPLED